MRVNDEARLDCGQRAVSVFAAGCGAGAGIRVTVAAIREETDPEINDRAAADEKITVHWLSLGEFSRLIEVFHKEDVKAAVMAGQVKHKQIFS